MHKKTQTNPLENLPFDCLGRDAMQAAADAGHEITVIETVFKSDMSTLKKQYFINRDGLAFFTGRSQSAIDKWIGKAWIKPARKFGSYCLFALEDVDYLLRAKRFPRGNVREIYHAATIEWRDMPDEVRAELDRQIAARETADAVEAGAAKSNRKRA